MARLSNPPASYPQWPVQYLMGCYARAMEEARGVSLLKDAGDQQRLIDALTLARQLTISYTGFILTMEMFPQPPNAQVRGSLQLLDSLFTAFTNSSGSGGLGFIGVPSSTAPPLISEHVTAETQVVPMPAGFLEDLATRFAEEGFEDMLSKIIPTLMRKLSTISVLGDFSAPLGVLERLVTSKPVAPVLVELRGWVPRPDSDGRAIEFQTLLGTAFGISAIPDLSSHPLKPSVRLPDVVAQYFPQPDALRQSEVRSSISSIHSALGQLHSQLHRIMMALLRNSETRDAALSWLASAICTNQERAKMRPDVKKSATDGFMINIVAVMLRMCDPFMDPASGKAWSKLNSRYASDPQARGRCFDDDTRLAATSEAVAAWASSGNGDGASADNAEGNSSYHFICEIFFLTGMALRLGFSKAIETCTGLVRTAQHYAEDAEGAPPHQAGTLRAVSQRFKGIAIAMETCFKQDSLINEVIAYYRLLSAYLLRLACPSAAAGGPPTLPLPEPAPMEFASLPEFYVEDLCVALTWVARARPDLVSAQRMDEYMLFFTVFMGSPSYVKNPYLRGKMVEALTSYMPPNEDEGRDSWRPRVGGGRAADEVATLFEVHPLVIGNMVRALISLFVDIERTDRANAFYEKFNMRYHIGEIMGYLWRLPQHRGAWRDVAVSDPKLYIRFVNFILADSQHLLQEALDTLPSVQETERLQDDRAAWDALNQNERADRLQALETHRNHLRSDFALAEIYLKTMNFTSEDPTVASRFFDVQVRDRQARILNFFLRYLTLPSERRRLKLKDPERYGWRPKELIASLASVHVNLYRTDKQAWCEAVAADTDYYGPNPEIFEELISVLRALGLASPDFISDLEALAVGAAAAVSNAAAEEDAFENIPEEYEDQLLGGIMWDPVKLPSGQIVNRATILQQLLTDQRDPFNRAPMTEEDLVECPELKAEVAAWVADQRAKRKARDGASGGAEAMES
jgi:ubiquitin conjugation factor E4 B